MNHKLFTFLLTATLALGLASCSKDNTTSTTNTGPSLSEYLASKSNLSLFSALVDKAQLQSFKDGPGPFTWFVPTNDAMTAAGVSQDSINRMTAGQANFLALYQLINGLVTTTDMVAQNSFPRATQISSTQNVYLGQMNDSFYVNGTRIITPNVAISNGIVHVVERLNVPPRGNIQGVLGGTGQHALFIAALTRAGRWTALGTTSVFTVFAPTDAAMSAAGYTTTSINAATVGKMDSLVRYHMFSGARLFTNDVANRTTPGTFLGATRTLMGSSNGRQIRGKTNAAPVNITRSDILATNGVVHVIDGILTY